jgi:energy-coupling factor transporter ATPase
LSLSIGEKSLKTIEATDLTYTYPGGNTSSLKDISITINKGEFVVLTGPSGCGKTTFCRCLNGLIPHFYSGKIEGNLSVAGLEVIEHPISKLAQHVGLVFQNPENQLFSLSVEKDVAFGLENLGLSRKEIRKRVDWGLTMTGIENLRERAPYELSGGQQQRVAIASVLVMQPDIIVFDEPTSFLDPVGADSIFRVINELNEKLGITVILVEHRLDLISRFADRVIIMDEGKVVLDGNPREIFHSEQARLIGIGIPKATELYYELKKNGVVLREIPVTSNEISQLIREMLKLD